MWIKTRRYLGAFVPGLFYVAVVTPAQAISDKCASVADYTGWAECVRRDAISPDQRLNLVYQKLTNKLHDSTDAVNHLRNVQRRWIAFRDAQCELEGLPSAGDSVHTTVVSKCIEGMAVKRTDYLINMLTCREGDPSCPKAVGLAHSDAALSNPDKSSLGATQSGVPFESPDIIEKFKVSGIWFPEETKPYIGLSGTANFVFLNVETHETFKVSVDSIALLSEDFWNNKGVSNSAGLDAPELAERLRAFGVLKISLSPEKRATVSACDTKGLSADANSPGDQCMRFGSAAVDIQDVDFDGKKEFIFRQAGEAQRGLDTYKVMKLSRENHLDDKGLGAPLSELDQMSDINISKRQIILIESNGACNYAIVTYAAEPDHGLQLIRRREYTFSFEKDACYVEDYVAIKAPDGKTPQLKLTSRKLAE